MRALIRCDGNDDVGLGHLSRSIALAEALEDLGGEAILHGHFDTGASSLLDGTAVRIGRSNARAGTAGDAAETAELAESLAVDWIVVDGYRFDASFLERLSERNTGRPLVVVDDFGRLEIYPARSRILNFTFGANSTSYRGDDLAVLRGPQYTLVRRAVRRLRVTEPEKKAPRPGGILVAIGGVDRSGVTVRVLEALVEIQTDRAVEVVLRDDSPDREQVGRLLAKLGGSGRLFGRLPDLAKRFGAADACITGGGLTKYEACYLGLACGVVPQSEGEAEDTTKAEALGVVETLSTALVDGTLPDALRRFLDPKRLARLATACATVFPKDPTLDAATALFGKVTVP